MSVLFSCIVLGLISALLQPRAEALVTRVEMNRVLMAYNAAFDICKGITDSSRDASKAAADEACDQAFKALDKIKLNNCRGWRNAGCRLARQGDQHRQCTCLISDCDAYAVRSHVITSFQDCAPELWTQELATGEVPEPTPDFKRRRIHYDSVLQAAASQRASKYSGSYGGSYGWSYGGSHSGSSNVCAASGAGISNVYGDPITAYPSQAPGESYAQLPKPHACDECGIRVRSARALFSHKKIHHNVCDTHCYLCNATFIHIKGFEAHLRKRHPEIAAEELGKDPDEEATLPYRCQYCGRRYSSHNGLGDHLLSHTTENTKCRVCKKILSTRASLKIHMRIRHPDVPLTEPGEEPEAAQFVCEECGKPYATRKGYLEHKKSHTTLATHCVLCNQTLSTKANYKSHMKRRHPKAAELEADVANQKYIDDNPEECAICKKRFKHKRGLREHMDIHEGRTTCNVCGTFFPRRTALNRHRRQEHLETQTQPEIIFD